MDPKTKQLIDEVDAMYADRDTAVLVKIPELIATVREQDKRARHTEAEQDAFGERIKDLEAKLSTLEATNRYLLLDRADAVKILKPFTDLDDSLVGGAKDAAKKIAELGKGRTKLSQDAEAKALTIAKLTGTCEAMSAENQRLTKAILEFTDLFSSDDPLPYQTAAAEAIKLRRSINVATSPKQTPESQRRKASQGIDLALSFCLLRRSKLSSG